MEQKEIEAGNKAIAKFDGWVYVPTCDITFTNEHYERGEDWCSIDAFTYHNDWSALMPVVIRIEQIKDVTITIQREATIIKVYQGDLCLWKRTRFDQEVKINHVYTAVIQFIEYKNKEKV